MEEVIGSIPIRSTNKSFNTYYLRVLVDRRKLCRGVRRVLKFVHFQRHHHLNYFCVRVPLLLRYSTSVDIERRPAACMPQQFLRYFDVDSESSQVRRK
jgi:hypothetical protein